MSHGLTTYHSWIEYQVTTKFHSRRLVRDSPRVFLQAYPAGKLWSSLSVVSGCAVLWWKTSYWKVVTSLFLEALRSDVGGTICWYNGYKLIVLITVGWEWAFGCNWTLGLIMTVKCFVHLHLGNISCAGRCHACCILNFSSFLDIVIGAIFQR